MSVPIVVVKVKIIRIFQMNHTFHSIRIEHIKIVQTEKIKNLSNLIFHVDSHEV